MYFSQSNIFDKKGSVFNISTIKLLLIHKQKIDELPAARYKNKKKMHEYIGRLTAKIHPNPEMIEYNNVFM